MISGATLRVLRIRAGRKQAEVATAAGIPASVLSAYERGHRDPGLQAVSRILDALGLEVRFVPRLDPAEQGRILVQVLELAEALPYEPEPLAKPRWGMTSGWSDSAGSLSD